MDVHRELCKAVLKGNLNKVKKLLSNGAKIDVFNNFPIRYAAHEGHLEIVKYLVAYGDNFVEIESDSVNPHTQDEFALCFAADNGHLEVVKFLIEDCECSVNVLNGWLFHCVYLQRNKHPKVYRYFSKHFKKEMNFGKNKNIDFETSSTIEYSDNNYNSDFDYY